MHLMGTAKTNQITPNLNLLLYILRIKFVIDRDVLFHIEMYTKYNNTPSAITFSQTFQNIKLLPIINLR